MLLQKQHFSQYLIHCLILRASDLVFLGPGMRCHLSKNRKQPYKRYLLHVLTAINKLILPMENHPLRFPFGRAMLIVHLTKTYSVLKYGDFIMGNMLTTVTSNWFAVTDTNLADALISLNNLRITDDSTYLEMNEDGNQIKLGMSDTVNWDKYLNEISIFDLFAGLLAPGATMIADEIAYMDGSVAYSHRHEITPVPLDQIVQGDEDVRNKLRSDDWSTVVATIDQLHEQINNLKQLCKVMGIPFAFVNCFHFDMWSEDRISMLGRFCALSDAPYSAAVIGFLVHQCVTLATADCGDIGRPVKTSDAAQLAVWSDSDPCESFSDAWDSVDDLFETIEEYADGREQPRYVNNLKEILDLL